LRTDKFFTNLDQIAARRGKFGARQNFDFEDCWFARLDTKVAARRGKFGGCGDSRSTNLLIYKNGFQQKYWLPLDNKFGKQKRVSDFATVSFGGRVFQPQT